MSDLFIGACWW